MDGFHLYKHELQQMSDPVEAFKRRGAPFTFNPAALALVLQHIRTHGYANVPSFDHKVY